MTAQDLNSALWDGDTLQSKAARLRKQSGRAMRAGQYNREAALQDWRSLMFEVANAVSGLWCVSQYPAVKEAAAIEEADVARQLRDGELGV